MTRASDVEGSAVTGPDGSVLGTLEKLLFHPSGDAVVVGAVLRPPAALVVVERPETYVPLAALDFAPGGVTSTLEKLPKARGSAETLGYDPDLTVIWSGMNVAGPSGRPVGIVADVDFEPATGVVTQISVDGGAVANAAYGMLVVPADTIRGYSEGAIRVALEAPQLDASGGLAKASAAAVVGAAESVSAVGDAVEGAVVRAGSAAGRAIKAVKDTQIAEKAARSVGATWRDSVKAFKDGMKDDD